MKNMNKIAASLLAAAISTSAMAALDTDGDGYLESDSLSNATNTIEPEANDLYSMTFWTYPNTPISASRQVTSFTPGTFYFSWVSGGGNDVLGHYDTTNPSIAGGLNPSTKVNGHVGYEAPTALDPLFAQMPALPKNPTTTVTITHNGSVYNLLEGDVLALAIGSTTATRRFTVAANWAGVFPAPTVTHVTFGMTQPTLVSQVPVPAAAWLFGSAVVGLAGVARQRKSA